MLNDNHLYNVCGWGFCSIRYSSPKATELDDTNTNSNVNDRGQETINLDDISRFSVDEFVKDIGKKERKFWEKQIEKYVKPHDKMDKFTNERESKLKKELFDLRNTVCLFVYLSNAILVTVMFGLTQVNAFKSSLTAGFDCGGEKNSIVPIAILFSAVFVFLLLIQFLCMLYHRFSTLVHITANTNLRSTENEHIAEIMTTIIKLAIQRSRDEQEAVSNKSRKVLDSNRSVMKADENHLKSFKDLMRRNKSKLQAIVRIKRSRVFEKSVSK
ncbi:CHS1 [Mytilus coruscus]|uniref:CHS1 n=1 Tax=Mytilus coruscus TaxID=42192 RepID=A0A6J8BCR0_MYTCO|nr:CHS1 [Mytilus coruscus]